MNLALDSTPPLTLPALPLRRTLERVSTGSCSIYTVMRGWRASSWVKEFMLSTTLR